MPRQPLVPAEIAHGPFLQSYARQLGVSADMLSGRAWQRLFPRVWVHVEHDMTPDDWLTAARLALPPQARLSHASRLRSLGLDIAPLRPFHFTVASDLHLDLPDIFLHRTEVLPPTDDVGVSPAAAFVQVCATGRMIDAVTAGDWLLHRQLMSINEVSELIRAQVWRPGALQARRIVPWLDSRSASPKESEIRCLVVASGLPTPEVNAPIFHAGRRIAIVDLLFALWRLIVEFEGRQHAFDVAQFNRDIVRYADLRSVDYAYVQVTQEMSRQPRAVVLTIDHALRRQGFDGPAPVFGQRWDALFRPIRIGR